MRDINKRGPYGQWHPETCWCGAKSGFNRIRKATLNIYEHTCKNCGAEWPGFATLAEAVIYYNNAQPSPRAEQIPPPDIEPIRRPKIPDDIESIRYHMRRLNLR